MSDDPFEDGQLLVAKKEIQAAIDQRVDAVLLGVEDFNRYTRLTGEIAGLRAALIAIRDAQEKLRMTEPGR